MKLENFEFSDLISGYVVNFSGDNSFTMKTADADSLGENKLRKNWNSIGDHAPAYLINLCLATGEQRYYDFLEYTADTLILFRYNLNDINVGGHAYG